jgi:O-antigen ligase
VRFLSENKSINQLLISSYLLQLIAFVLPVSKKIIPLIIILWVINGLFFVLLNKHRIKKQSKPSVLMVLYLFYVVYFFISPYKDSALFDLEVKLSIMLFPLGFYFTGNYLPERKKLFKAFILGVLFSIFVLFIRACYLYFTEQDVKYFTYSDFSFLMHTSYYSMYVCWALYMLITDLFTAHSKKMFSSNKVYYFLTLLLSVVIFLLASKTGIIVWLLIMIYAYVLYYLKFRNLWPLITIPVILIVMLVGILSVNNKLFIRFKETYSVLFGDKSANNKFSSTTARTKIWPLAWQLIKENPAGYGTGAEKEVLKQTYLKNKLHKAYEKQLNAHNQFLQTGLALGLLGMLLLMALFIRFLFLGIKFDEWLLFGFALITSVNFITESMLETQAGVVFFAFFYSLLDAYFKRDYAHLQKKTVFLHT